MNFYKLLSTFVGNFCPPGSGSGFRIRIRIHRPNWIWIQSGSGSTTLRRTFHSSKHERFFSFLDNHFGLPEFASRFWIHRPSWIWIRNSVSYQGCGSGSAWISIIFESYSWIRIGVKKLDPDPHYSQNSKALEAQNRAVEGRGRSQWRPGGSKWSPGGFIDQWSQIPITLKKSRIRIRINV